MLQIHNIRKLQNMSQLELAKKINIKSNTLCQYEKGQRIPNVYILYKISKVLNCTIEDLITEEKVAND